MNTEQRDLRRVLSANLKKRRLLLGITQEKLAEKAEISANMVNDIEGCRTWVSDKTLVRLAAALQTDVWSLFLPHSPEEGVAETLSDAEIVHELIHIKQTFDYEFEHVLKTRGL
ncbi:MAG: helix-turn-helix domain-containing protein [Spirochaetaceae bacterium]|jgi:transcriptional regulator with XRE-family HTH domain|nr:helix-turn-helix domain-containing protein [Spirochaetaceae bacterium]